MNFKTFTINSASTLDSRKKIYINLKLSRKTKKRNQKKTRKEKGENKIVLPHLN